MLDVIKKRIGIHEKITTYDDEVKSLIEDAKLEMESSGVPETILQEPDERVVTAITCYVKAHLGNDRTDTNMYMDMFLKKTFRLTLEGDENVG